MRRVNIILFCVIMLVVSNIAIAETIALFNFNDQTFNAQVGSGSCVLVNTISNWESDTAKVDPNDYGIPNRSIEIAGWPLQNYPAKTHGIRFNVSTVGKSNIKVKWDIRHNIKNTESGPNTSTFQYSTNGGATWIDGPTWVGYGDVWYFNREVDLSFDPNVNNNPNFCFRIIADWQPSAGMYMPVVGSNYANNRKWRLDLVEVHNNPTPPAENIVALWDFNDQRDLIADYGDGNSFAELVGGIALDGDGYSKDYPKKDEDYDQSASSDPSLKGRGLDTQYYPSQGGPSNYAGLQFNLSTVGYTGIKISFDIKHKQDSSRYVRLQYTLNRNANPVVWINADPLFSHLITEETQTTYWFNGNTVDLSNVVGVNNNPNFAFRIVTAHDPLNPGYFAASKAGRTYNEDPYYNKMRFDMIKVTASSEMPLFAPKGIIDAKMTPDWERVSLTDVQLTNNHPDYFWVETENRACGLKIYHPQHNIPDGMKVNIEGITRTGRDGEKYIYANNVQSSGYATNVIKPLFMTTKYLGGGEWNYDQFTGAGQQEDEKCAAEVRRHDERQKRSHPSER
ncbi:MAG: hypothetical protein SNJ70_11365, partial [Armatimonadota bacterium]